VSTYPEILIGADVAADILADYPRVTVQTPGSMPRASHTLMGMVADMAAEANGVICVALPEGINVCPRDRYGLSINSWGDGRIPGTHLVAYPTDPVTRDTAGFKAALREVLVPVVESALAAVDADRPAPPAAKPLRIRLADDPDREGADLHIGRSFEGHTLEDSCPCVKAACGLVPSNATDPGCLHHPAERAKTIRQSHSADRCPARAKGTAS
jgi:hypothetical protein